jgi:hypothetical protein
MKFIPLRALASPGARLSSSYLTEGNTDAS